MQLTTKIFYVFCIIFSVITAHYCSSIPESNLSEYKAKHLHYLEERRKRLENEKENEKKEHETWSNTFYIGTKQILDQSGKVILGGLIGTLLAYPFEGSGRTTIARAIWFISMVTLNWKFYSPVQQYIIHKEARKIMLEETCREIEEIKSI